MQVYPFLSMLPNSFPISDSISLSGLVVIVRKEATYQNRKLQTDASRAASIGSQVCEDQSEEEAFSTENNIVKV
jgi:hypothetical protein